MAHNILLLFLSDVKVTKDRKHLLPPVAYPGLGKTMTTNESAVRYLVQKNGSNDEPVLLDKIFAFATDKVRNHLVGQDYADDAVFAEDATDQNGRPLTHLAFFKYRLKTEKIVENIDSCMTEDDVEKEYVGTVCPFDDTSNDVTENMKTIAGMANRIQTYIQTLPESEQNNVVLHADMTGGFRHASMMMLAVMRLMQYQGVKIGHVVYSNYNKNLRTGTVQEVGDIYRMFDLVAGAEEFASFGSVQTIRDYFGSEGNTPVLENLVQSMEQFAEAVKLSRRKDFDQAIQKLQEAFQDFTKNEDKIELKNALMGLLQKRIEQDYELLWQEDRDELAPIEWCLAHDYLQQALTLYTETVLDYLFTKGILTLNPEKEKAVQSSQPKEDKRDLVFYLVSDYVPAEKMLRSEKLDDAENRKITDAIHDVISAIREGTTSEKDDAEGKLQQLLATLCIAQKERDCFTQVFNALNAVARNPETLLEIDGIAPEIKAPLQGILKQYENEMANAKYGSKKLKTIFNGLLNIQNEKKYFELFLYKYNKNAFSKQYAKCKGFYNLIYLDIIQCNRVLEEDVYQAMQKYFEIKAIRNDSAHAKLNPQGKQMDANELKDYMLEGIRHLRLLKKKAGNL